MDHLVTAFTRLYGLNWAIGATVVVGTLACGERPPSQGGEGIDLTIGDEGSGDGSVMSGDDADGNGPDKLDVAPGDDPQSGVCDDGNGPSTPSENVDLSLIWIANSPQGTVSKIDTRTGIELARYTTGPGGGSDDPSRTSVNLSGDVAVTNRAGSITKIAASIEGCVDRDGDGEIQSSSGPDDVLPWMSDECVLWHAPLLADAGINNSLGPRPTAWDTGPSQSVCDLSDDRVWVGWHDWGGNAGVFRRLAGSDGATLDEVRVPDWNLLPSPIGPYGGAVDPEGNLWVTGLGGPLVRIDGETLNVAMWRTPQNARPYGIAVDGQGHPWLAGLAGSVLHFDPSTETFDVIGLGGGAGRGLQVDRDGYAWIARNEPCGLVQVDTMTNSVVNANWALPGCDTPVGVSVDVDGFVWVPDEGADLAFRVNPLDGEVRTTVGLASPYTYSDMTGAGLQLVTFPPQG